MISQKFIKFFLIISLITPGIIHTEENFFGKIIIWGGFLAVSGTLMKTGKYLYQKLAPSSEDSAEKQNIQEQLALNAQMKTIVNKMIEAAEEEEQELKKEAQDLQLKLKSKNQSELLTAKQSNPELQKRIRANEQQRISAKQQLLGIYQQEQAIHQSSKQQKNRSNEEIAKTVGDFVSSYPNH